MTSSTPPHISLGNDNPKEHKTMASAASLTRPTTAGERVIIDAAPDFIGGRNPEEQRRTPPGGKTLGTKGRASPAGERGVIDAAPDSLGEQKPQGTQNDG